MPPRAARLVTPPPPRGKPYYDVARGRKMIIPREGGKAVPYIEGQPRRFDARATLRRTGLAAREEARASARTASSFGRAFARETRIDRIGAGELLVYMGFTLLGLALLDTALRGRGPAAVSVLFDQAGGNLRRLFSAQDPIIGYGASDTSSSSPPPGTTTSSSRGGRTSTTMGRPAAGPGAPPGELAFIGRPGQGTHTRGNWQSDAAVDVALTRGTPIYAAVSGTIGPRFGAFDSSDPALAGLRLTIVGRADELYYAHLSAFAPGIAPGSKVRAGQLIGYSGTANGVDHLHLAALRGDPATYARRAVYGVRRRTRGRTQTR